MTREFHGGGKSGSGRREPILDAASILRILRDPQLRMGDVAAVDALAAQLLQSPQDAYLQDVLAHLVEEQSAQALLANDPFLGSPPPLGVLPSFSPGRFPLLQLASGEIVSDELNAARNILVVGPTGMGKSNWLKLFLYSATAALPCLVLAFDRKRFELVDCSLLTQAGLPLLVLDWRELKIALLQPPSNAEPMSFANTLVHLLAREASLFASRRLMLETLSRLLLRQRPAGTWPTLSDWHGMIEKIRVSASSRLGNYREAAMFALGQVLIELGPVINYAASDMLDRILAHQGVVVIVTEGLSSPMQALLASVFLNYAFRMRQATADYSALAPLYCVVDDALPLAFGSVAAETEGGMNPLAEWCFMGRSCRMGLVISAQNFAILSPALRANCHVTLCMGSYGRDAEELGRHMSLTREQAERLPFLIPGEAVVRIPPWPAMRGRIPEVS